MDSFFRQFSAVAAQRHQYAREWKDKTKGEVVGYLCTDVPEEILYAAGVLPVRIFGSHQPQDIGDRYISAKWCPHCRDCLAQGLNGAYSYLDGVCYAHTCEHISQTFYAWKQHLSPGFSYFLGAPFNVYDASALKYFRGEVLEFKTAVEGWLGKPISSGDLDRAIEVYNTNRCLMRQVYELMKQPSPPISGSQAMEMVMASFFMDKAEHNQLLRGLWEKIQSNSPTNAPSGPRLMLVGGENDDVDLVRFLESLGGRVVVSELCTGTRYFWSPVALEGDRIMAIARRYLDKPPCPQKDMAPRLRLSHIQELARDYRVRGAINIRQRFCDMLAFDIPAVERCLKEMGIPMLTLELDVRVSAEGFRTRVEAFLEMLQMGTEV